MGAARDTRTQGSQRLDASNNLLEGRNLIKICSEILDRMYGGTDEAGTRDLRWANFGFQQV